MLPKNIIYQTTKKEIGTMDATSFVLTYAIQISFH